MPAVICSTTASAISFCAIWRTDKRASCSVITRTIYRNVDATLYGLELEVTRRWTRVWESRATLAYVHAENTTDSRASRRFHARSQPGAGLSSGQLEWRRGTARRGAADSRRQRSCHRSGLDVRETPGFAVLDLYGKARLGKQAEMKLGIDNVLPGATPNI